MLAITRLVITRKSSESFTIGDDISITLGEIRGNQIRVIIDAPENLSIKRDNMIKDVNKNNKVFMRDQASKGGLS